MPVDPAFSAALGAMLLFGVGDVIYKRAAAAGVRPHHLLMLQSWVFLPSVAAYGLATGTLRFVPGSLWGAVVGVFVWLGFYNFAHSLRSGAISINAPVFRLSFIITAALAIALLGEPVTAWKITGIALAVVAVWLLLGATLSRAALATPEARSSLARVLLATAAVGVGNLVYKYGLHAGATPASLVVAQAVVVVSLSTILVRTIDGRIRAPAVALRYAVPAAIVLAVGFALLVESLARGDASRMVPISQMGLAVSAVLGVALFGEAFSVCKALGLAAALIALASFAHG